jgi:hypothetical protein
VSFDDIKTGSVIEYPYLWGRERARGETEGRKHRPTAVGVRFLRSDGTDAILLFPITTKSPHADQFAVELPDIEKKRAGLDANRRLWLILYEYNYDSVADSSYLEPNKPRGVLSKAFLSPLITEFIARRARLAMVNRTSPG